MATAPPSPSAPAQPRVRLRGLRSWIGSAGSTRRTLLRNGAWEWLSFLTHAGAMFFLSPFIVARLGDASYGVWELVIAITGYLSLADFGVRPAVVHFIARHDAVGDMAAVNRYVNSAFLAFGVGGFLALGIAVPLAYWLPSGLGIAEGFANEATLALIIVAAELTITLPFNAFSAVLVGKQRYDLMGRVRLAVLVIRTALIVLVLSRGMGLVALACVHAGVSFLEILCFTIVAFRVEPGLRFAPRLADRAATAGLMRYGGWAIVALLALQITWATDPLLIGAYLGAVPVAWFAIGAKLPMYAKEFLRVGMRVAEPATGALEAKGDAEGICRLLTNAMRFMVLLSAPVLIYLATVGPAFLGRWMGASYRDAGGDVLLWMTLAVLPAIASYPLVSLHYGTNRVRPLALLLIVEAVGNLGLSLLLVSEYGIAGVAFGTLIPAWLLHGIWLPHMVCRRYGVPYGALMFRTWIGPVVAGLVTWLALDALVAPGAALGWGALFGLAFASVAIYAAAVLLLFRFVRPLWGAGALVLRKDAKVPA